MNLQEAADKLLLSLESKVATGEGAEGTVTSYSKDFNHIISVLGAMPLEDVSEETIDIYRLVVGRYISPYTGKPLSPHTINKRLKSLRRLLIFCKDRGYMTSRPQIHIKAPPVNKDAKTIPVPSLLEIYQYARTKRLNRERDTLLVVALAEFGPRRSEVQIMRIGDVDPVKGVVYIDHRKTHTDQDIPVSPQFLADYFAWLAVRPKCDHDYVFCNMTDKSHPPLTPDAVAEAFRRMSRAALNGKSWGPHSVRRCFISHQLNHTPTPPNVVKDIVGHKNIQITMGYANPDLGAQRAAIEGYRLLEQDNDQAAVVEPVGLANWVVSSDDSSD